LDQCFALLYFESDRYGARRLAYPRLLALKCLRRGLKTGVR
jgi:hypothetical protein